MTDDSMMKGQNGKPVQGVVPIDRMIGDDHEDAQLLRVMLAGAEKYLRSFPWCKGIREIYFGDGYGGVVAVFLFHIEASRADVDEWLWVISCDVSPAHLVTDECKTPSQALEGYIRELRKWAELAKEGRWSNDVMPVYISATAENALDVERRLEVLQKVVVPAFRETETVDA